MNNNREIPWVEYNKYKPLAKKVFDKLYPDNSDWVFECNTVGNIIRIIYEHNQN